MAKEKLSHKYNIPKEGSLGLLALGDVGLRSWREAREELKIVKEKTEGNKDLRRKKRD